MADKPINVLKGQSWKGTQDSVPFTHGYDAKTGALQDAKTSKRGASGWLSDGLDGDYVDLYIYEIQTTLSLAGSTGQGRYKRDFYARNLQQPSYRVMCQAPSQASHARVVEFIRDQQKKALTHGQVTSLWVPAGGTPIPIGGGMRGRRSPIVAEGYVKSIERFHTANDFSPEFAFEFVISRSVLGPFAEPALVVARQLKSWAQIVDTVMTGSTEGGWTTDPDGTIAPNVDPGFADVPNTPSHPNNT